ncbi:MAG: 30S ribosomal protein S18 [Acidobacteria bacterium]|nr:30S ribosomal protein S18 [Acidobacteriota bacterium]
MPSRRGRSRSSGDSKTVNPKRFVVRRKRFCKFCADKIDYIDFKDQRLLGPFIPERGKILPRRISGVCATHQRKLSEAIKRARHLALLPFTAD